MTLHGFVLTGAAVLQEWVRRISHNKLIVFPTIKLEPAVELEATKFETMALGIR